MRASRENWVCPACGAVNDGRLCRIDGTRRDDPARVERWVWQCQRCFGLNDHDDAWCHSCGEPALPNFGGTDHQVPWITLVLVVAFGGLVLPFVPLIVSIGAVAVIGGGAVALVRSPIARRTGRFGSRSDALVFVGLCLWLVAQALPAYTTAAYLSDEPNLVWGVVATLLAWIHFFFVPGVSGLLITFAWSANVWLALAVLARWRWPEWMVPFAALAEVACAVGIGILVAGGVPEAGGHITEVGVGSWLWMAGTLIVLAGAALPVAEPIDSESSQTT